MFKAVASLVLALFSVQLANAAAVNKGTTCPGGQTVKNAACCVLFPIMNELQSDDDLLGGECEDAAHSALRIAFHDAIGFSTSGNGGGGADGSIVVFNATELTFDANDGIDDILDIFADNIRAHPEISPGDYLQFANAVGLTNCPGAPRIKFFLGRPQPVAAAPGPEGGVPKPTDSVATILARFADAGFSARELVALLASHSTAGADTVDPARPGSAFDSTPSTFDTQFFVESILKGDFLVTGTAQPGEVGSSVEGTLRLESDHALAHDSATACAWQEFALDQQKMATEFGAAMVKLSLLGHNQANLIDCSDVIPAAKPFSGKPFFPPTLTHNDVETPGCSATPFPTLSTAPGPATSIAPIDQD